MIGVGAGQQSRIHCTRLAGNKADIWFLRQHPKVLGLKFKEGIRRPDRDNTIDVYISDEYMDVLADGVWENLFEEKPEPLTCEEKRAWLDTLTGVSLGSDAFFPCGDNIERAHKSGLQYIACLLYTSCDQELGGIRKGCGRQSNQDYYPVQFAISCRISNVFQRIRIG